MELENVYKAKPKLTLLEREQIERAYAFAAHAHEGQTRKSGDPYMIHPLAVAHILAELRMDAATLCAALLHDVVEDTHISLEDLENKFGIEVARLVSSVTKIDQLPTDVESLKGTKGIDKNAEFLRKTFLAMGSDIRVILIKLADRLHNMRTLSYLSPEKQQRMAKETLEIFAPLANRLGIWQMKWELEDLSFRYLNPDKYKEIAAALAERRVDREQFMNQVKVRINAELGRYDIQATISARPKHIYSIWRKMERKRVPYEQIYDVRAVRIIVPDKNACYLALGVIHEHWRPIPGEFDDYIAAPKDNYYRSLHTAVLYEGKTLEVQIRTPDMHEHAEYGVAAHWRYKEGGMRDEQFDQQIAYVRRMMEFSDNPDDQSAQEFIDAMKSDVFEERVYAFTPKGDIMDLPGGATAIDFAYQVHTDIGNRCRGAKVNGSIVTLDYKLKSGDRVEIITSRRGGPSLDWLNENLGYTHTNRARSKIRSYFRKLDREKNISLGRDLVDRELKRLGLEAMPRDKLADLFNYGGTDDLYAAAGFGDITGAQIATKILEAERKAAREAAQHTEPPITPHSERLPTKPLTVSTGIDLIGDNGSLLINLSRCCNPTQGDTIIGYITRGNGISVHRTDCPNILHNKEPERLINVSWGKLNQATYPVPIVVKAYDREGLLRDVSSLVANEHINIANVSVETPKGIATLYITLEIESTQQLSKVLARIEQLPNVIEARRRTSL